MEWLQHFHFMRPFYLLAFFPLLFVLIALWRYGRDKGDWNRLIDADLLPFLMNNYSQKKQSLLPVFLLGLAWLFACIALAGPSWQQLPVPVYEKSNTLVIVLDNTPSMLAQDAKPSRVIHAAREIEDVLSKRREGQTALITYSQDAFIVSPLTRDTGTIALLAKSLSPEIMPAIGNQPLLALEQAISLLGNVPDGRVLWITDEVPKEDTREIITLINNAGIGLSIMGIGTTTGAPIPLPQGDGFVKDGSGNLVVPKLNRRDLQDIANQVKGKYHDSTLNDNDLNYLLTDTLSIDTEASLSDSVQFDAWKDESWMIALLLLIPAALAFRQGNLLVICFALLPLLSPNTAQANWWDDLWLTKNQQAQQALNNGDTEAAANLFDHSQWRGSTNYKNGDYDAAIDDFSQHDDINSLYNKANAQAKSGQLQEALESYEHVLKQNKQHEDALFNKALVEQLLKQQKQDQSQKGDKDQNSDNQESESNNGDQSQSDQNQQANESSESQQNSQEQQSEDQQSSDQQASSSDSQSEQSSDQQTDQQESTTEAEQQATKASEDKKEAEQQREQLSQSEDKADEEKQRRPALPAALRRVEDDPGGLLRRKFQDQSQQRQTRKTTGEQRW